MKNIFKQFVGSGTLLNRNDYSKAVIDLTVKYTVGVLIILTIFNFLVYGLFSNNIESQHDERIEHSLTSEYNEDFGEEWVEELETGLVNILLISDAIILILTFIAGYLLSKRTLAPLEENYKKQSQFIADAAHELRTPLAVMQAGSEVILRTDRNVGEYKLYIEESLEEVKRLTTLSNNLLFLASSNRKKDSLMLKVSLSDICSKQVDAMRAYANAKDISIIDSIEGDIKIIGIKDDLTRLVINLLKNAIDYNIPKGTVTVSLKKATGKNQIELMIEDTGMGIDSKDLPHIFERFYKADSSRQQNSSGTGLGLGIVKGIVNEHKGSIKVNSILGKGSKFVVILPCA